MRNNPVSTCAALASSTGRQALASSPEPFAPGCISFNNALHFPNLCRGKLVAFMLQFSGCDCGYLAWGHFTFPLKVAI
jgi:hypothetical protein